MLARQSRATWNSEGTRAQKVCPSGACLGRLQRDSMPFSAQRPIWAVSHFSLRVCWATAFLIPHGVYCVIAGKTSSARDTETVIAVQFAGGTDAEGFPAEQVWENAPAIHFAHDWQGKNEDPGRKTEARLLWTRDALYVNFLARYRSLTVFADAESNGRRDQLWERDVVEVFLQ